MYLKCTGQQLGPEGSKRWLTVVCGCTLCRLGVHVALHQVVDEDDFDIKPRVRHIALSNLEVVGAPPRAEDYP